MSISTLLFSFEGRIGRARFWGYFLPYFAVYLCLMAAGAESGSFALPLIYALAMLCPTLAVNVKRCHDRGHSGWFFLLAFVPILSLWYIIEIGFLPGVEGPASIVPDTLPAEPASSRPSRRSIESALRGAGYTPTFEIPKDTTSMADTLVQSLLARQACESGDRFETGERNPQRILCSDDECPCTDRAHLIIGKTAYLYISEAVVDFRKNCQTLLEREFLLRELVKKTGGATLLIGHGVANPLYLCETGARRRGLNLAVALADARMVAETGFAPLRPTPCDRRSD